MNLHKRIEILTAIGRYILEDQEALAEAKMLASRQNSWFTHEYIAISIENIAKTMLDHDKLVSFASSYPIVEPVTSSKTVGVVMAGNIPLVGFHDLLCVFLAGHHQRVKLSTKDNILLPHLIKWAENEFPECAQWITFEDMLKGCDAYIATGSDNTARYFEQYFEKYPNIIRKNRTSIAILTGKETNEELSLLADDIQLYFGMGCRNVTKLFVPKGYDFVPILQALKKYEHYKDHAKYRHNFDYQLTIAIMNNQFYMTNESIVLIENEGVFSPIGQLNYQFYANVEEIDSKLDLSKIQCIVGHGFIPFGKAQKPELTDFADGIDTMSFLSRL